MAKGAKTQNSIIFLTTLSVYLGLVLVGGSSAAVAPQVLAQAALTRNFEIQTEIEVKDDLDNKPDADEEIKDFSNYLESYFRSVGNFVDDLQKLHSIGKFDLDLDYDKFEVYELGFVPCNVDGDPVRRTETTKRNNNRWLEPALTDATYEFEDWDFLSDCLKDEKFKTGASTSSALKLSYDNSTLNVEVSAFKSSPQKAAELAEGFRQALKVFKVEKDELIIKEVSKSTSFKSENNQVFIVTRLPRAAIDSLSTAKNTATK